MNTIVQSNSSEHTNSCLSGHCSLIMQHRRKAVATVSVNGCRCFALIDPRQRLTDLLHKEHLFASTQPASWRCFDTACPRRSKRKLRLAVSVLSTAIAPRAGARLLFLLQVLADTHALLLNGCVFAELPAEVVLAAARDVRAAGGAVFFDPGTAGAHTSGRK